MVINTVLREEYGQLPDSFRPVTIVDAGAYIGDTAAYFASRFPDATIVALEASGETFEMASFNLSAYGPSVVATHAALWTDDGEVVFGGADTGAHVSSEGTAVPCVSVMSLMTERRWSEIDLLKMDIEGAELPVLLDGASTWLDSIGVLIAELHGTEVEKAVLPLLRAHGFGTYRYRSVWYAVNPGIAQETAWAPFIERW